MPNLNALRICPHDLQCRSYTDDKQILFRILFWRIFLAAKHLLYRVLSAATHRPVLPIAFLNFGASFELLHIFGVRPVCLPWSILLAILFSFPLSGYCCQTVRLLDWECQMLFSGHLAVCWFGFPPKKSLLDASFMLNVGLGKKKNEWNAAQVQKRLKNCVVLMGKQRDHQRSITAQTIWFGQKNASLLWSNWLRWLAAQIQKNGSVSPDSLWVGQRQRDFLLKFRCSLRSHPFAKRSGYRARRITNRFSY